MENDNEKHLKLIQTIVDRRTAKEKKSDHYKKRSSSQKDFYAKSRIAAIAMQRLKEALLSSVVMDDYGEVLVKWNEALVEELLDDIKDPGSIRTRSEQNLKINH